MMILRRNPNFTQNLRWTRWPNVTNLKQYVYNEDVEDIFERDNNTVKDCFELGHSVNGLEGPEDSQQLQGFQFLARWGSAVRRRRSGVFGKREENRLVSVAVRPSTRTIIKHQIAVFF